MAEVRAATAALGIPPANLVLFRCRVRHFAARRQEILEDLVRLNRELEPTLVFMPSVNDLHQDHHVVAAEGLRAYKRRTILAYEMPWNNIQFATQAFIRLREEHVARKVRALAEYRSQTGRPYATEAFLRSLCLTRGVSIGAKFAEAFEVVRWVLWPRASIFRYHAAVLPNVLLAGQPRCGTTHFAACLAAHPEVFVTPGKEIRFFDRDENFARGLGWYEGFFEGAEGRRVVLEATPSYLVSRPALGRIRDTLPGVRVLAIFRDPVVRAYSHYWKNVEKGREPLGFGDAIQAEPERVARGELARFQFGYVTHGLYASLLSTLFEYVPRERAHAIFLEDLVADPERVLPGVFRFLGVGDSAAIRPGRESRNRGVAFRSRILERLLSGHGLLLDLARRLPGARAIARIARGLNRTVEPPPIPAALELDLRERFRADQERLAELLGRPVPAPGACPG